VKTSETKTELPILPGVNLLPPEVHQRRAAKRTRSWLFLAVAIVLALTVGGVIWAETKVTAAENRLAEAEDEHERLRTEEEKYAEVPIVLATKQNAQDAEFLAMWREIDWQPLIDELVDSLPNDVDYQTITITAPGPTEGSYVAEHPLQQDKIATIDITGTAQKLPDNSEWIETVEDIEGLSHPWISATDLDSDGNENTANSYSVQGSIEVTPEAFTEKYIPGEDTDAENTDETED